MPWQASDAAAHMKGLSSTQAAAWAKIANSALESCLAKGGVQGDCEGQAIRIANAQVKRVEAHRADLIIHMPIMEASVVDASKGVFGVTLIAEGDTLDGQRRYPAETLAKAAPLFEGAQAYADHPTESEIKDRPERSIRDLVGIYEASHCLSEVGSKTRIKANLHTLESATWIRPLLATAVQHPNLCGLSIHAEGSVVPSDDGVDIVESIDRVISVDIVTRPNAGGAIERLIASQRKEVDDVNQDDITLEWLKEHKPELVEALTPKEVDKETPEDEIPAKPETDKALAETVAELTAKLEAKTIAEKIGGSQVLESVKDGDRKAVSERLASEMAGKSDEDMDKVVESYRAFIRAIGGEINGVPAKETQDTKKVIIGSLLPEAARAAQTLK